MPCFIITPSTISPILNQYNKLRNKKYFIETFGLEPVFLDFGLSQRGFHEAQVISDFNRLFQNFELKNEYLRNKFRLFIQKFTTGRIYKIQDVLNKFI